jgi:lipopolysaccharide/colanic/teichoic acid biosynthesis glycosyltransferase
VSSVEAAVISERASLEPIGGHFSKRVMDLVVSTPPHVLALPVVPVLATVLAIQHRGNLSFSHERNGLSANPAETPKLRTVASRRALRSGIIDLEWIR